VIEVATLSSILAICLGGSFGCLVRWLLSSGLNSIFSTIPLGTLTANLLGGYLIGIAMAYLSTHPMLAPEWRLFVVTGLLGGLTTFSTFSAETVSLLQSGRIGSAMTLIALHLVGTLGMTFLGIATMMPRH